MGNFNLDINETYSTVFKKVSHSRAIFASEFCARCEYAKATRYLVDFRSNLDTSRTLQNLGNLKVDVCTIIYEVDLRLHAPRKQSENM